LDLGFGLGLTIAIHTARRVYSLRTRLKKVPILGVLRHLFLLNRWQYRDKYIIVIVVVSEKIQLKNVKRCHEWYLNPGSPAAMACTLTTEPQRELVAAANQAY